jgi:endoribonuclease Dicer
LLPFAYKQEEVKEILKDVDKREGMAKVSVQIDPWKGTDQWFHSTIHIQGLPPLETFTHARPLNWDVEGGPTLYMPDGKIVRVTVNPVEIVSLGQETIIVAQNYTRRLFWWLNGSRMAWTDVDFSYLFLPSQELEGVEELWDDRRSWLEYTCQEEGTGIFVADAFNANAEDFGQEFDYPDDITIIRDGTRFGKTYKFIKWRNEDDALNEEELEEVRERYGSLLGEGWNISYPLLQVETLPPRRNFLIPTNVKDTKDNTSQRRTKHLLPSRASVVLASETETQFTLMLPSILRSMAMAMTVQSFKQCHLISNPLLSDIPDSLLMTALTAPAAQEKVNYQRLETLGDTLLKFVMGVQLLAEHPLWHEGYISRKKDHSVSNARLARENVDREMYRWIIRGMLLYHAGSYSQLYVT